MPLRSSGGRRRHLLHYHFSLTPLLPCPLRPCHFFYMVDVGAPHARAPLLLLCVSLIVFLSTLVLYSPQSSLICPVIYYYIRCPLELSSPFSCDPRSLADLRLPLFVSALPCATAFSYLVIIVLVRS